MVNRKIQGQSLHKNNNWEKQNKLSESAILELWKLTRALKAARGMLHEGRGS